MLRGGEEDRCHEEEDRCHYTNYSTLGWSPAADTGELLRRQLREADAAGARQTGVCLVALGA